MKQQSAFFAKAGIITISIFGSSQGNIQKYARQHVANETVVLSDDEGRVYEDFQVKRGTIKTAFYAPFVLLTNLKKYTKFMDMSANEPSGPDAWKAKHLPADFLINEEGIVVDLFRAERPQDHMPISRIEVFVPHNKRCGCNKQHCIFTWCRENYKEIRKESEAMLQKSVLGVGGGIDDIGDSDASGY